MRSTDFLPWYRLCTITLEASTGADTLRIRVTLPPCSFRSVFRVTAPTVAGSVQVRLRFGFGNADADASSDTILFAALAAVGGVSSQLADTVTAANGALWIVPPRVSIFSTTVGFTGVFSVDCALQVVK